MRRIYDNIKLFLRCTCRNYFNGYNEYNKMNSFTEDDYKKKIHELELEIRSLNIYIDYLEKELKKLQS